MRSIHLHLSYLRFSASTFRFSSIILVLLVVPDIRFPRGCEVLWKRTQIQANMGRHERCYQGRQGLAGGGGERHWSVHRPSCISWPSRYLFRSLALISWLWSSTSIHPLPAHCQLFINPGQTLVPELAEAVLELPLRRDSAASSLMRRWSTQLLLAELTLWRSTLGKLPLMEAVMVRRTIFVLFSFCCTLQTALVLGLHWWTSRASKPHGFRRACFSYSIAVLWNHQTSWRSSSSYA